MQSQQQTTGFFGTTFQKDTLLADFCNAQVDTTCQTRLVTKYEEFSLTQYKSDANRFFNSLFGLIPTGFLGSSYSFAVQTNLETLQKYLNFKTKRDLAYNFHNLRIVHVVNSHSKNGDPYILTATYGSKSTNSTNTGVFGFNFNQSNPGIEFSVYDMQLQKYTMLHYVDCHDMFQNQMSFDYNDYYFGTKRKFEVTRQEEKRQKEQSKRTCEDSKTPKVETQEV